MSPTQHEWTVALPAMGHWGTCPLQQFRVQLTLK